MKFIWIILKLILLGGAVAVALFFGTLWIGLQFVYGDIQDGALIGWYRMDTNSNNNGTTLDDSGQNNTGTFANIASTTFYSTGKLAQGFLFDGVDDDLDIKNPTEYRITGAMSLAIWIDPSATTTTSTAGRFISKNAGASNRGWEIGYDPNSEDIDWYIATSSTEVYGISSATDSVKIDGTQQKWYHIAGVYSPSTRMTIYINGVKVREETTGIPAAIRNSTVNVHIGKRQTGCANCFFSGRLDDVRIYNRALSDAEVAQIYNQGLQKHHAFSDF